MLSKLQGLVLSRARSPGDYKSGVIAVLTILSAIAYFSKFIRRIETVTIRHAIFHGRKIDKNGYTLGDYQSPLDANGRFLDNIQDVEGLEVGVPRLEDVGWLDYEDEWDIDTQVQRTKTLYTADDVRERLRMMQKCVKKL